jgi:hypothetical protein
LNQQDVMLAVQNLSSVCDLVRPGSPVDRNMITPARCRASESHPVHGEPPALGRRCRRLHVLAPLPVVAHGWTADIITAHQATLVGINMLVLPSAGGSAPVLPLEKTGLDEASTVRIALNGKLAAPLSLCVACDEIVLMYDRHASPALRVIYPGQELEAIVGALDLLWSMAESAGQADRGAPPPHLAGLVEQFAAGVTDRAAQRALSISGRTLSRRAAEMLRLLNSRNRFQAGAEAVRRNWI